MCRFLLVRSKRPVKPKLLLEQFADMAQMSRAPDGDRQGDGWGIAIKMSNDKFQISKSLKPIWECQDSFDSFAQSTMFAVHARSASFPNQKGVIEYNQPYTNGSLCFVFNGVIHGVQLNRPLTGTIGAQKIFSLVREELETKKPTETLESVRQLLKDSARKIIGLNIGLIVGDKLYALCVYADNAAYFGLKHFSNDNLSMICSETFGNYAWQTMEKGTVIEV